MGVGACAMSVGSNCLQHHPLRPCLLLPVLLHHLTALSLPWLPPPRCLCRGDWSSVHSVLSALLDPAEAAVLAADWAASSPGSGSSGSSSSNVSGSSTGGWEQEVMLHHPGSFPQGAICPAQLLLAPSSSSSSASGSEMDVDGTRGPAADAAGGGSQGSSSMQACLWLHPAAAAEAHAALQSAASASGGGVSIAVLDLRRLEIRGGAAVTALAVALAGATAGGSSSSGSQQQDPQPADQQQLPQQAAGPAPHLPAALAGLQHGEAVQLLLPDPRLRKPVALGSAAASLLPAHATGQEQQQQQQPVDLQRLQQAPLPLSEAELSVRRQRLRRQMLQLGDPAPSTIISSQQQKQGQHEQQGQEEEREEQLLQRRGHCPAVIVRHDPPEACGIPGSCWVVLGAGCCWWGDALQPALPAGQLLLTCSTAGMPCRSG